MHSTMKLATAILPGLAYAFPGMVMPEMETRQAGGLGGILGGLTGTVEGLVGSVVASVDPDNKRPEPGFPFKAPGPGDSRGPCPGLNTLANHGYLPRNGHVSFGQVLEATARGFNMGADLATVLCVFAILTDGDVATETFYLGAGSDITSGTVGGLNRHDTVEADISPNREDYYNGCGDNHHLSSRMFTQNVELAAKGSGTFDMDVMGSHFVQNAEFSKRNNPYLYYFPFPSIVSFVAFSFYPAFFSNGTYGSGGVANYDSISSIIGAKYNKKTKQFEYVPERFPENWYRRSYEYDAVQALADGLTYIYARDPVPMPIPQLGAGTLNASTLLCDVYNGIQSVTPLALGGDVAKTAEAITWATTKFDNAFGNTLLGCPKNSDSPNAAPVLFPHKNQKGGPLASTNPSKKVIKNTGNNVYHKTYFKNAPVTPQCNHAS